MKNRNRTFMAMSLPVIIIFFCFHTIPLFCGFFYSLTNSKGFGVYDIIGLKNYIKLFQNTKILNAYAFTFKFAIVTTILVNVISILLALGLNFHLGEQGVVLAAADVQARMDLRAALTDKDVARRNGLAVRALNAKALGLGVTAVLGRTYALFMSEKL